MKVSETIEIERKELLEKINTCEIKEWTEKCPSCKDENWEDEGIVDVSPDGIEIEWRCDGCGTSIHLTFGKFQGYNVETGPFD